MSAVISNDLLGALGLVEGSMKVLPLKGERVCRPNIVSKDTGVTRIPPVQMPGRATAKEIVSGVMAARKASRLAADGVTGRFATQSELLAFLTRELSRGQKLGRVAREARIGDVSLRRLINAGKVSLP